MEDTTISSGLEAAAPVELTPMSEDEGDRAIENLLSGSALPKGDTVAEGKAPPSAELSDEDDHPLVIDDEDDGQPQQTAQAPAQPVEPGDDVLVTLSDGQKISLGDLKKSPFLQRDYTFKQEGLKKEKTDFETWRNTEVKKIQEYRDQVLSYARQRMPQPPDESLADENSPNYDPFKYQAQEIRYKKEMAELTALERKRNEEHQAEVARQKAEAAENDARELERFYLALPKLRDNTRREAFFQDVRTIIPQVYGLDAEEILALPNSGAMRMVYDAIAYRKALDRGKAVVKELPAKPKLEGRQRSNPASDLERDAQGRFKALRETGSVEAADRAIEAFLSRKG